MTIKTESAPLRFIRSLAAGVLLSMIFFYCIHVFGTWRVDSYRPDPETTSTVQLHNTCAVFDKTHILNPNTDVSKMGEGVDGTKLGAAFMNFWDGHVIGMIICAVAIGVLIFLLRNMRKK
jgi:hypothetical protein